MTTLTGQSIRGYELHELIGEGGFGAVYRATQTVVDREVVIKIILPHYANQPEFIRRFEAEAQLVAKLEHLHIVPLYDYWRDPSGAYLVMRFLRGGTLRQSLEQGALSVRMTSRILTQIGSALSVAHRNNVVHRDVKPSNILLDDEKNAYLSDFGIATQQVENTGSTSSSRDRISGSAGYISPEQINLQPTTARTDIYAMGIILYEMLTGRHPYSGAKSAVALFIKHANEQMPVMEGIPEPLQEVVFKAAAKNPADRYNDMLELASAFRKAATETNFVGLVQEGDLLEDFDSSSFDISTTQTITVSHNPYKGLRAFQESDAEDFFGREALTKQLLARMDDDSEYHRFLAVVGPSGSGKSSVVKAGVLPALRRGAIEGSDDWFIVEMVPSTSPLNELSQALASIATSPLPDLKTHLKETSNGLNAIVKKILPVRGSELLIVIDQFEEAFTQGEDEERTLFLEALYNATIAPDSNLRVIVTLRADFYDRPLMVKKFSQLMQQRTEVVIPLTVDELERAITTPARQVKVFFQQGLSAQIVSEVNEQPGILPMLQYALTELFERREGTLLTTKAYQEIGGVLGALARRAEEIHAELSPRDQEITRQIFLRLVTLGEGTEDTRRRALQSELLAATGDPENTQNVLNRFGGFRLLTYDRDPITRTPTVEVAHEALIREWQRLREWLDESREDIRLQRMLLNTANEWEEADKDASFLLRGGRLVQYEDWQSTTTIAISERERDFLRMSIAERQRLEAAEQARLENERLLEARARQRARLIIAILAVAFALGVVLSIYALNQSQVAQVAAQDAILARETAEIAQIESENLANNAQTQVVVLATAQSDALLQANNAQTQAAAAATAQNEALQQAATATFAQGDALFQALTATFAQGDALLQANNAQTQAAAAATAQNEALLQAATATVAQGDALFQALTATFAQGDALIQANNAQTQAAAAATAQNEALQQAATATFAQGDALVQANNAQTQAAAAATAQNEALQQANIAATAQDNALIQANTAVSAQEQAVREAQAAQSLALAANASQLQTTNSALALALALEANNVPNPSLQAQRVLFSTAYTAPRSLLQNPVSVNDITLSPDNTLLYTANVDGTVTVWNLTTRQIETTLEGHSRAIRAIAISPNGQWIATASEDRTILIRRRETNEIVHTLTAHTGAVNTLAFSPNSAQLASGADDASVILWNVGSGEPTRTLTSISRNAVNSVAYSPNNRLLLVVSDDAVRVWNFGNSRFADLVNSPSRVRAGVFTADSQTIVLSGSLNTGTPQLWDANRLTFIRDLTSHNAPVNSVMVGLDGDEVLSASDDFTVIRSDFRTGGVLSSLIAHSNRVVKSVYTSDETTIFSVSSLGEIFQWDTTQSAQTRDFVRQTTTPASLGATLFSPSGKYIIGSVDDGNIQVWDANTNEVVFVRNFGRPPVPQTRFTFHPDATDDNLLGFLSGVDIRLVNLTTNQVINTYRLDQPRRFIENIATNADGTRIAAAGGFFFRERSSEFTRAGFLTVWDVETGNIVFELEGHNLRDEENKFVENVNRATTAVAFSPDNQWLVSGAENGTLYVWDMRTGERVRELIGHADRITKALFSADGTQLLTSGADRVALLWDFEDGQLLRRLSGHRGEVTAIAFNRDETSIITGSSDTRIIIWNVETGQTLQQFVGSTAPIISVAFSDNDTEILSGSFDGKTTIWSIETTEQVAQWARENRYIPQLTCVQRAQFGLSPCDSAGNPPPPS